jgi:putative endonuclease
MRGLNVSRPVAEWRDPRHRRGLSGEVAAARFLEARGFSILAHRYRLGHHDVDLVARRGRVVAFVEVKARTSATFGSPAESVGWRKRRDLCRVAEAWIARHGRPGDLYRFDLVSVCWFGPGFPQISHIEGAFMSVGK